MKRLYVSLRREEDGGNEWMDCDDDAFGQDGCLVGVGAHECVGWPARRAV